MDRSQQHQTDSAGRQRPANIAKDDPARLARQVALALTRQPPKAHKLAPIWPAIRDMLALGYSLRYAVRKLKAEGCNLSLSQAVRYRKKLGLPGYPDAPLPPPARLQTAPRPVSPPLPTVTTSHDRSPVELPQGLEPIEAEVLTRLDKKDQAKFWNLNPNYRKIFLRRKLEEMTGDR